MDGGPGGADGGVGAGLGRGAPPAEYAGGLVDAALRGQGPGQRGEGLRSELSGAGGGQRGREAVFGGRRVGAAQDDTEPDVHLGAGRGVRAGLVGEPQKCHGPVGVALRHVLVGGGAQDGQGPLGAGVACGEELSGDLGVGRARRARQQGGLRVQGGPVGGVEAVQYGGPGGRVAQPVGSEPPVRAVGGEQSGVLQGREGAYGGALVGAAQPCEVRGRGRAVQYGDGRAESGGGGSAAVQAGEDGPGVGVAGPAPRVLEEGPQEQRVAAAGLVEQGRFRLGAAGQRGADGVGGEPQADEVGQAEQFGAQQRVAVVFVRGGRQDQQDGGAAGLAREVEQVPAGGLVHVVQVVHADHHGCRGAQFTDGDREVP